MRETVRSFGGVPIAIASTDNIVFEELSADFKGFPESKETPLWSVMAIRSRAQNPSSARLPFRLRRQNGAREILHRDGSVAVFDRGRRRVVVFCREADRLRELAFEAVLSRAGEELDHRSRHRVHALGFGRTGASDLLLLPSGGGKSTLARELARLGIPLLSDESPLLSRRGVAWPFALPIGVKGAHPGVAEARPFRRKRYGLKWLLSWEAVGAELAPAAPVERLIIASKSRRDRPRLVACSRLRGAAALLWHMVVGFGIAQGSEYLIPMNFKEAFALLRTALSRLSTAWAVLRRSDTFILYRSRNPARDAALLAGLRQANVVGNAAPAAKKERVAAY